MIRKLRIKFIIVSALSVFFVLAVTIGAINIVNYVNMENNAQSVIQEIVNQGPKQQNEFGGPRENEPINLRQEHYFVVTFNADGTIKETDNRQMFILTKEECDALATRVYNNELNGGKYDTFRYTKMTKADGLTYVGFVDIRERIDSFNGNLLTSSLISIAAYLALIGLIIIASKVAFKSSEEAYNKQKRFITNASHELKTPLAVISTDLDLIEMDNGKSEWSESIRDQLNRLTTMVNELVTLSKFEEGDKNDFPFADFSINDVAINSAKTFKPLFQNENIKFSYNVTGNITMFGNKNLIDELIHIFLENSLKYTGGESKSSYFTVFKNDKGKTEFRFSNTIDKNDETDVKQMMDRFYRAPSVKKEGSGIGLSIAQEIIHLHKGKIKIDKTISVISFMIVF